MKFSVNWLREFVDLPDDIAQLTDLLTMAGVEIEGVEQHGADVANVVVAQILTSAQHPNADRLSVCEVDDGSGTKRQIVCGAKNYKAGDKVPLALPGAKLPNGLEIKKSKLRGVDSEGMLCSPIELGLGQESSGLLILSPDTKIGAPIGDLFPSDTVLDVEITPNRGDLLSHFGLAREIAALTRKKLRNPAAVAPASAASGVKISAPAECPFFSARRIERVKVGPSPAWLRARIESVGIRSINNIVDISNFVMLELGQPTHAFDADKLKGAINVRLAKAGEKFLALDGKTYSLRPENLVIADEERAVGIGGVMGGEETGVTDPTTNVLLEAAYFLPASIRRTARSLGLPSDASYRFERGVDPGMVLRASQRATQLIQEITGGTPAGEILIAGKLPADPPDVSVSYAKCDQVLGIAIKPDGVDKILEQFGLEKSKGGKEKSAWKIPSHRRDLQRDVDLIEEVARAHGVGKIPGSDRSRFTPTSKADRAHDFESLHLRGRLAERGLSEVRTSKLIPRNAPAFGGAAVELRNPLTEDHVALRPSLISGLLGVLDRNVRAGAGRVAIFEIGRVFVAPNADEKRRIGILFWGEADPRHWRTQSKRRLDFFDLKGALDALDLPALCYERMDHGDLALAAEIRSGNSAIGVAGRLSGERAAALDAPGGVFVAEIDVDSAIELEATRKFREIERFPAITRDIAMMVPEKTTHREIEKVILDAKEPLLESVRLFDLFEGSQDANTTPARKSLAYTLTYRDKNRTLTSEEVSAAHAKIRERLQRDLRAELRE